MYNKKQLIILFSIILLLSLTVKLLLKFYFNKNMKIEKEDEKDILSQELNDYLDKTEPNVLSEEDKDLGVVIQPQPEI